MAKGARTRALHDEGLKGYNGWTNYETWAVALWIDNDEKTQRYWRDLAQRYQRDVGDNATVELAQRLKAGLESQSPDLGCTLWSDLLNAALSEVNWHEIAEHLLAE